MGFFKSKEEKQREAEEKRRKAEELRQRIEDSEVTLILKVWLQTQFGERSSEKIRNLRNGFFYKLEVFQDGIMLTLLNRKGEKVNREGTTFSNLGYENLPSGMAGYLQTILLDELKKIPYLRLSDEYILAGEGIKSSW